MEGPSPRQSLLAALKVPGKPTETANCHPKNQTSVLPGFTGPSSPQVGPIVRTGDRDPLTTVSCPRSDTVPPAGNGIENDSHLPPHPPGTIPTPPPSGGCGSTDGPPESPAKVQRPADRDLEPPRATPLTEREAGGPFGYFDSSSALPPELQLIKVQLPRAAPPPPPPPDPKPPTRPVAPPYISPPGSPSTLVARKRGDPPPARARPKLAPDRLTFTFKSQQSGLRVLQQ